jgi:ABC-type antimicrobial peptide transport system permease subunit
MGVFAVAGLTLALVGVYGITAFSVSRRLKEIGIRLTLGGDPASIRRMVLLDSTRLALAGAAVGALAAWVVGRALAGLLFRTQPTDPVTWATVLAVLVGGAVVAAWLPARRATRVDPREVLGSE